MSLPRHSAVLCALGLVACLTGHALIGSVPAVGTNQWAAGPALTEARAGATATSLGDGNVLVTGGRGATGPLASVELLTSNGTAVPVAAMSLARAEHTAALVGDTGNVLVAGGTTVVATETGTTEVVTGSVEVFDSAAAVWYPVGALSHPRAGATAVALPEGRVAIVGGHDASGPVLEIEIYDPAAGAFGPGGAISAPRAGAAVTSTRDGHIVVVGGSVAGVAQATADIIDPVGGTVATVALTGPRTGASATTTVEDQVLIAGGSDGATTLATTEVLDPVTGNSASGATLSAARTDHRAYLLPHNGGVLLVGGSNSGGLVAASELVIPWVSAAQALGPVADPRSKTAGAAGPQDGVFVVAGGSTAAGAASASSDYLGFATVKTDKDDYAPGQFVTITGSGWQPGETVNLVLREVGTGAADTPLNALVLADGTFVNDFWAPNESHLGVRFYLTAAGAGATAQTTFTDANKTTFSASAGGGDISTFGSVTVNQCATFFVQARQGNTIEVQTSGSFALSSTATGTTFFDNGTCSGPAVVGSLSMVGLSARQFSFTISTTGSGTIRAAGTWDTNANQNATATVTATAARATATNVTCLPAAVVVGQGSSCTATVTDTAGAGATAPVGTVTLSSTGTGSFGGACTLAAATASSSTCSTSYTPTSVGTGTHTIGASYAANGVHAGSTDASPFALTVSKASTTTTITGDTPDPTVVGQSYAVNWTVTVTAPGSGTPTGNVTVDDGTGGSCFAAANVGTCNLASTSVGPKTLTATYAGDANFNGSADTDTHQVNKADTTTLITSDTPDPTVVGQSYAVNWTVTVTAPGSGTPTGNVTVDDGTGGSCFAAANVGTCNLTSTLVGAKTLTATYAGDANFNGSADTDTHQVNKADTATTITSDSPDPTVVGQQYTVQWTFAVVAPGAGTPTGNVTVDDGTGGSCFAAASAGTCNLTSTSAGAKTLTATYAGDANFNASADTDTHQVNKAATTLEITSDTPDPSVVGQSYTVQWTFAIVAPGAGTPSGNIVVSDGAVSCNAPATVGTGSCSLASTSAGAKTLTATFTEDAGFLGSSDTDTHTANKADTATTITSDSPDPTVVGQEYTVQWTFAVVAPGAGTPTGNVTVDDGTGGSCFAAASAGTCNLTSTSAGAKTLTATYAGDANFNGSADTDTHQVNKADTTTLIASDTPDPTVVGQSYTVNWTVTVTAPGAGTPTGNVSVDDGTGGTCSAAVGVGTCNLTSTSVGAKTLTATYAGDANFNGSADTDTHQVNKADTATTITSDSPDPTVVGQQYTVQWTFAVVAPGTGTPTGNVTVDDGTGGSCVAAASAGTCNLTSTSAGAKTLTATYAGDANFNGSADTDTHQVNKADTTTLITSDTPDPTVVGQSYAVAWTVTVTAPGAGTPTGNVTVDDGTGGSCFAAASVGTCNLTSTSAGAKTLTATYAGDANFNGSADTDTHQVNKANTTTAITSDTPDPSVSGQSVTITFGVSVNAPGAGTPTGLVTVSDGTLNCSASVAVGQCDITFPTAGMRTLTATYAGDSNFNGSVSPGASHLVNKADTATVIISDLPDPSLVGQSVVISFGVSVSAPGAGTPTGTVTVSDGVQNCSASVAAGQCTIALVTPGLRTLVATYAGDVNFNGSVSPGATHNVNFQFFGFFAPVDNQPVVNDAKAGQAIPVKWRLVDSAGNAISSPSSFVSLDTYLVSCGGWDTLPADSVPEVAAGSSGLQYHGDGNWQFNWKTPKQYANQCRLARVTLSDGSVHDFNVKFKP